MSSGDLTIGARTPATNCACRSMRSRTCRIPRRALLEHVRFSGARLLTSKCRAEPAATLTSAARNTNSPLPPDRIDAECTLASITVPNHVHLLRAEMGGKRDQAHVRSLLHARDAALPSAHAAEIAMTEAAAGCHACARRRGADSVPGGAGAGGAQPRRTAAARRDVPRRAGARRCCVVPQRWQPAPRFVEAAAALTVAYLAVEILLLPQGRRALADRGRARRFPRPLLPSVPADGGAIGRASCWRARRSPKWRSIAVLALVFARVATLGAGVRGRCRSRRRRCWFSAWSGSSCGCGASRTAPDPGAQFEQSLHRELVDRLQRHVRVNFDRLPARVAASRAGTSII